jgi:hypothetical protein
MRRNGFKLFTGSAPMTIPEPRNRVVVFRLSQQEYQALKSACSNRGGRNLSDFTRSELLALVRSESLGHVIQRKLSDMEQKLVELHVVVCDLTRRLDGTSLALLDDKTG